MKICRTFNAKANPLIAKFTSKYNKILKIMGFGSDLLIRSFSVVINQLII